MTSSLTKMQIRTLEEFADNAAVEIKSFGSDTITLS
jgi:hypothetical protein